MIRRLPRRRARRARGVALLLVLIVLILVSTLAVEIALTARTHSKLASHAMHDFLLRSVIDGRRHILLSALRYDRTLGDNLDTEKDQWSWSNSRVLSSWGEAAGTAEAPTAEQVDESGLRYRNRDVKILAWCEDERSKINLRGLLEAETTPTFTHTRDALVRLIDRYREKWTDLDVSESDAQQLVDELADWLREKEDSDENPLPATRGNRGRLLALEDLLRVPGGKWKESLLYDVRDPDLVDEGDFGRRVTETAEEEPDDGTVASDSTYERSNGVPGLLRYVTVWTESTAAPVFRINVNTAPRVVLEALLEPGSEDLADAILKYRRQGPEPGKATSDSAASTTDEGAGWFKSKNDLTKVEGMGDDLTRQPRLNFFADVQSAVYSLRVVATIVTGSTDGESDGGSTARDLEAVFQYREVVQRTEQGFVSLHAERRNDPMLGGTEGE